VTRTSPLTTTHSKTKVLQKALVIKGFFVAFLQQIKRLTRNAHFAILVAKLNKTGADMKELKAYVEQKNKWNAIFKGRQFELQTAQGRQEVANSIDADLSPENLTCDGELPRSQVQAKYRQLTRAAEQLISIDPGVKFYEFSA
jgi:hypothetical protein